MLQGLVDILILFFCYHVSRWGYTCAVGPPMFGYS